ncbi:MAG TPA: cytidine deaminase [Myxococcaceae bacterium]|nr:cytidine deaminase [Myxococcaceae bacterium]
MEPDWSSMESAARAALPRAYAPYSRFPVAAAIQFADGAIVAGVNVENVSYPLSLCAERAAVAGGIAGGHGAVQAVLVLTDAAEPTPPCGGCRQVLAEFGAADVPVRSMTLQGRTAEHRLGALLPDAFRPESLDRRNAPPPRHVW